MQLGDCLTTGGLDRSQCLTCSCRLSFHHTPGPGGLHPDDADVVGHDIMKLAGDAYSFGEHRLTRVLLSLGLELNRLVSQLALTISQRPDGGTQWPWKGDYEHVVEEVEDSRELRPARMANEIQLADELGHDRAVTEREDWRPKPSRAVNGDAVDHHPRREQRNVCLRNMHDDPSMRNATTTTRATENGYFRRHANGRVSANIEATTAIVNP